MWMTRDRERVLSATNRCTLSRVLSTECSHHILLERHKNLRMSNRCGPYHDEPNKATREDAHLETSPVPRLVLVLLRSRLVISWSAYGRQPQPSCNCTCLCRRPEFMT